VGEVSEVGGQLHVSVGDGAGAMLETVRILDAESLEPSVMVLREPTLDDVFFALTGHGAEPDTDGDSEPDGAGGRGRHTERA
jgi:hypothetical protein